MRKILFILLSFLAFSICYSDELAKNQIDKIVYSHRGNQDKPVWATQMSYYNLGSYTNPETKKTNDVFYYGLMWFDSIMGPVYTYKIDKCSYSKIKKSIESYSNKVDSPDSLENRHQFGTMCVSIVEKGEIKRFYFSKKDIIKLFEIQIPILENDTTATEVRNRLKYLRNWFINSDW